MRLSLPTPLGRALRAAVAGLSENGPLGETAVRSLQEWHALSPVRGSRAS